MRKFLNLQLGQFWRNFLSEVLYMTANEIVLHVRKLEKALVTHADVEDAVVLSEENPESETFVLKVFVEPSSNDSETEKKIREFCISQSNALPTEVIFREIPRTPSGKVARQQLLMA
ncbi:MAG: long-chain fatty acid--CoA ligase [Firmicutes bacterium]|nr:long-chain fatty acid--CoA ligase [Bacillota bacterium]